MRRIRARKRAGMGPFPREEEKLDDDRRTKPRHERSPLRLLDRFRVDVLAHAMHAAVASVNCSLNEKPSLPKNCFDLSRSFTGRFTKIFRAVSIRPFLAQ